MNEQARPVTNSRPSPSGLPGRHGHISVEKPKNSKKVIGRLWTYLSKQKALISLILVLLLVNTATTLAGSYLLRPIINNFIIPHDIPGLAGMMFLLAGLYLTGALAAFW